MPRIVLYLRRVTYTVTLKSILNSVNHLQLDLLKFLEILTALS